CLRRLIAPLGDLEVGAATGELILGNGRRVGAYRRYDDWLRRAEADLGSSIGVTGALWALRRDLFTPLPPDILADDLFLPMMVIAQGFRVAHAENAFAMETQAESPEHDFARHVRTLAGNFQLLRLAPWLLRPSRNPAFFAFFSHKALRLLT